MHVTWGQTCGLASPSARKDCPCLVAACSTARAPSADASSASARGLRPLTANDEVDRPGTRVVVGKGSAYDLFLSRELRRATLVRVTTSQEVVDQFVAQSLDVAAGVGQQLEADARRIPGLRLLPGRFMAINRAMGIPRGRDAALPWLGDFVEKMKGSGFIAQSLAGHRIEGAAVALPAR